MFSLLWLALTIMAFGFSYYSFVTLASNPLGLGFLGVFLFCLVAAVMALMDDVDLIRNRNKRKSE